jgi:hypothetical protein
MLDLRRRQFLTLLGGAAVLRVVSGSSATRRMDIGKQSPSWAACGNAA